MTEQDRTGQAVIPLHPERTDDPATVSWQVGNAVNGAADFGPGSAAPLQCLVDEGVLAGYLIGADHVTTTITADQSWSQVASTVRAAVQATTRACAARWDAADPAARDALLAKVAGEVIAEVVAPTATAHGGSVELLGAHDGTVTVLMSGACHNCPASSATLFGLLEQELQARVPWRGTVRVIAEESACEGHTARSPGRRLLPLLLRRRS